MILDPVDSVLQTSNDINLSCLQHFLKLFQAGLDLFHSL
jgi:hypothetical protein